MIPLKEKDTIGFFSPSTPITFFCPTRFERAKTFLTQKGFNLKPGFLTGKQDGYRSGSVMDRAGELNELINDPTVDCIISTIGGMNSNSLLPYIDYDAFKQHPKILMGHSDISSILLAVYAKTGINTYYGPALVASFGEMEPYNEMTFQYFSDICIDPCLPYRFQPPEFWTEEDLDWETQDRSKTRTQNKWITCNKGVATGRLIIGNLNTITSIFGSQYMPDIREGDILFIEDTQKSAAMMERLFAFLKLNHIFDKISGLILGKHERFNDQKTGKQPYQILEEIIGNYDFPFLAEVDCCHTHPMFTMPIGSTLELNATEQTITLLEI
ncbi:MAG: LD-carboxypeptidase [Proteobacteria bacterium]|nr:LD-carboxypeptidase [Pseudomonadota bacterium]MBU1584432.1 LD-carboxypeptidase [Pseudomonadota bacterium]MBU2451776.1 LD-carboxypeptidase [Pseudomonadota bacterium]MBU2627801.1 LD-carboxypeptidase [Pseudomonadota bacterium]